MLYHYPVFVIWANVLKNPIESQTGRQCLVMIVCRPVILFQPESDKLLDQPKNRENSGALKTVN